VLDAWTLSNWWKKATHSFVTRKMNKSNTKLIAFLKQLIYSVLKKILLLYAYFSLYNRLNTSSVRFFFFFFSLFFPFYISLLVAFVQIT
jgi:uncharacterized integral membrane protein